MSLLAVLALAAAAPATAAAPLAAHEARGSFEVKMTPETETRFDLAKTWTGAMTGVSTGTMLGDRVATAYVAVERFDGSLDGRKGGFLMLHRGTMSKAAGMQLDIVIAPGSGTGALTGIDGRLAIEITGGKHFYTLTYSLPSR